MNKKGDISLEFSVLKTLLSSHPDDKVKSTILGKIKSESFAFNETKEVWDLIKRDYLEQGKKIPSLPVVLNNPYLSQKSKLFLTKKKYKPIKTVVDAKESLSHIKEYSDKRKIAKIVETSYDLLTKGAKPSKILSEMDASLFELRTGANQDGNFTVGGYSSGNSTKKLLKRILSNKKTKLSPTGFKQLDNLLDGGSARGELITISANTGGGKTVAAFNLLKYAYSVNKENVAIVELEMSNSEVYERLLSNVSNIPYYKIKNKTLNKKERKTVKRCRRDFDSIGDENKCSYTIWAPSEDLDIYQILEPFSNINQRWVIIDYINLIKPEDGITEAQCLSRIARYAKRWAQCNNCTVVLLTQLDDRTNDIRYSRAIKEHSNVWLKWKYGEEDRESGTCEWVLAKSRSSKLGSFTMQMELEYMRIKDKKEDYYESKDKSKQPDFNELDSAVDDF